MRGLVLLAACTVSATACATDPLVLAPRFEPGASRLYRLQTSAHTSLESVSGTREVDATLEATVRITVIDSDAEGARLRLSLEPVDATRDGKPASLPARQDVTIDVGLDGALRSVSGDDGSASAPGDPSASSLVGVVGPVLPSERVHLGDRWTRALGADGEQVGRVVSLRRLNREDSVALALSTRRSVSQSRSLEGRPLTLEGTELATSDLDWSLVGGYAIRIVTTARTTLIIRSGTLTGGTVTVDATTELTLEVRGRS